MYLCCVASPSTDTIKVPLLMLRYTETVQEDKAECIVILHTWPLQLHPPRHTCASHSNAFALASANYFSVFPHINLFVAVRYSNNTGRHILIFYFWRCTSRSHSLMTAHLSSIVSHAPIQAPVSPVKPTKKMWRSI